jgi:F-type H+-transporting ATPase subunit b
MDSFIETFHIDWKIIIAQSINFVVVLFVLYFLLVKPLKKMMSERSENIKGGLNDAVANAELLANTKKEYDAVISNARTEAHTIFQEGKKEAELKKAEILEKAQKEVEVMVSNGKKVLESEKAKILEEAKNEIVGLVVKATEKLLELKGDEKFDSNSMNQIKKM